MTHSTELKPTGTCWCGCGQKTASGKFFVRTHDKTATYALIASRFGGSVARFLDHHGFGPGRSILEEALVRGGWVECPNCEWAGTPAALRQHRTKC